MKGNGNGYRDLTDREKEALRAQLRAQERRIEVKRQLAKNGVSHDEVEALLQSGAVRFLNRFSANRFMPARIASNAALFCIGAAWGFSKAYKQARKRSSG